MSGLDDLGKAMDNGEISAKSGLTNEEAKWLLEEAKKQGYTD